MPSVLFVCLGNICRSPLAEGIFRHQVMVADRQSEFLIDSAGTGAWHMGNPPDPRSIEIASRHGIDIAGQRARQLQNADFQRFELILAMDRSNLTAIRTVAPKGGVSSVHLFLEFNAETTGDVPDPYFGGADGFETVYNMLSAGCAAMLEKL